MEKDSCCNGGWTGERKEVKGSSRKRSVLRPEKVGARESKVVETGIGFWGKREHTGL